MGFPNVDLILRDLFLAQFAAAKLDPQTVVADLFEDRSAAEQAEIAAYLTARLFTGDVRDRGGNRRVFILPHFPAVDLPFPQIGIYSGEVDSNDRVLGDATGETEPVYDGETLIGWDETKGYWELSSWNIDVIAATKDETIWLSRLCQYFICQQLLDLHQQGIIEVGIALTDLRMDKGTLQPMQAFVRGVKVHCRVANTWKKRLPVGTYQTGNNLALEGVS
jgi:hypothetical protein